MIEEVGGSPTAGEASPHRWVVLGPALFLTVTLPLALARAIHMPADATATAHIAHAAVQGSWIEDFPALVTVAAFLIIPLFALLSAEIRRFVPRGDAGLRVPLVFAVVAATVGAAVAAFLTWLATLTTGEASTTLAPVVAAHAFAAFRDCFVLGLAAGVAALVMVRRSAVDRTAPPARLSSSEETTC
ncbi:hypothetical protein [Micromonospora sp. KC213]|uniref:hypothetical protein n=1 Tax=Micromonospora sp. KC213 TaxID=2530378 RepID=UPI00104855CF|nr:hypothetical protein [Micromonospora sp. KC213]TDC42861.1 hypothetical protein E1166_06165 [Micromonospora sp. KC213]